MTNQGRSFQCLKTFRGYSKKNEENERVGKKRGTRWLYGKLLRLHQHCIRLWRKPHGLIAWPHEDRARGVTIASQGPSCNVNTVCSSSSQAALLSVNPPDHRVYPQTSTMYWIFFLSVILGLSAAEFGISNVAFAPSRQLFGRQASNSTCDGCLGMNCLSFPSV